jgi:hypothetical protein
VRVRTAAAAVLVDFVAQNRLSRRSELNSHFGALQLNEQKRSEQK